MDFDPFGPTPPTPRPQPPVPEKTSSRIAWVLLVVVLGWVAYDRYSARDKAVPSGTDAGRAYGRALAGSYADALDVYLQELAKGTPEQDAQQAFQSRWTELRTARHRDVIQPILKSIRPDGSEWVDEAQKSRYRAVIGDIQRGLRGVR